MSLPLPLRHSNATMQWHVHTVDYYDISLSPPRRRHVTLHTPYATRLSLFSRLRFLRHAAYATVYARVPCLLMLPPLTLAICLKKAAIA